MKVKDGFGKIYDIGIDDPQYDLSSLNGKKCLAIGDSYTNNLASVGGALQVFNSSLGMTTVNHGINGATLRDNLDKGHASTPIVCRVCHTVSKSGVGVGDLVPWDLADVGYIWVMGGSNDDYIYPYTTGTDPCDSDQTHLSGATNLILQTLTEKYPNVPIIVGLEPCNYSFTFSETVDKTTDYETVHRTDSSALSAEVMTSHYQQEKIKVIRDSAQVFAQAYPHVQIVDFCSDWYNPINPQYKANFWNSDKLHLSASGYQMMVTGTKYDSIEKALKRIFAV